MTKQRCDSISLDVRQKNKNATRVYAIQQMDTDVIRKKYNRQKVKQKRVEDKR